MTSLLNILLIAALGCANAAEAPTFTFAEAFTPRHGKVLEIGYRLYTAPMLAEISASGVSVERLEILPTEIYLNAGAPLSLQHLKITAFGPDGNAREHVPVTLDFEGPSELLDFEDFIAFGHEIRAARPGTAKIWITSILPSSSGAHARTSIMLVIRP